MDAIELLQEAKPIAEGDMPTNHSSAIQETITPVAQVADVAPAQEAPVEVAPIEIVPVVQEPVVVEQKPVEQVEKKVINYDEFEKIYEELQEDIKAKKSVKVKEVDASGDKDGFIPMNKYQRVLENAQEMAMYIEELEREKREQKIMIQDLEYEKGLVSERAKKYQEKATIVDEEQYERLIPESLKELVEAVRLRDKADDQFSRRVFRQQVKLLTERTFNRPLDDYIQDVDSGIPESSASESLASYTLPTAGVSPVGAKQVENARLAQMADLF